MFSYLSKYREKEIPNQEELRARKEGYRDWPIDFLHPLNCEGVSDIRDYGLKGENHYYKTDNPPYYERIPGSIPQLLLRGSVIEKFVRVDNRLRGAGLELYFFDCYRPVEVQNYFYDYWMPNYLKRKKPELSGEALISEVEKYWAKGASSGNEVDPNSPPPHTTGGAADLTIGKLNVEHLFMGSIFDDVTETAHIDYFEVLKDSRDLSFSEEEAMKNRRLLYWLLTEEGFASNSNEWWHFSWGDQQWAKLTGVNKAYYSNIK